MCKTNNSTTSTSAPNPQAMDAYQALLGRAGGVSNTPYTPYTGEFVAPVNAQQQAGIAGINQNAGFAQPYIQQAAGYANQAAAPITGGQIAGYQSPYTQQVIDATQKQFANQNAEQQSQLVGNAAAQGALGGDRVGVAQANLAGTQSLAQSPVIAGLYQSGFQNAQQMALAQQQQYGNAAYSLGNLGVAGQQAALSGAGAQVGAGGLQQQTQQASDAAQFQEFLRQQAYPFQTAQWLAGIDTGVGSQMGGTSTTTPPKPNPWSQIAGIGLAAAGAFAKRGGRIQGFDLGGGVAGQPFAGVSGYVPTLSLTGGAGAPKPPGGPSQGQQSGLGNLSADKSAMKGVKNLWDKYGSSSGNPLDLTGGLNGDPEGVGVLQDIGSAPELGFGAGPIFRDGGFVLPHRNRIDVKRRGFDSGGMVDNFFAQIGRDGMPQWTSAAPSDRVNDSFGDLYTRQVLDPGRDDRALAAGLTDLGQQRRRGFDDGGAVSLAGFGTGALMPDSFDDRFYAPSPPADPAGFNALQDYGASTPDYYAGDGAPAGHMAELPLPRERPAQAGLGDVSDLPGVIARGAPAGPGATRSGFGAAGDLGDDVMAYDDRGARSGPAPAAAEASQKGSGLFGLSSDVKRAMMAAGLGMMASHSPNFAQAIGEGGLQGLNTYSGLQREAREEKKTQATIDQAKATLAQHAKEAAARLALDTKKLEQGTEEHKFARAVTMRTPIKYGETRSGVPLMAMPKLSPKGEVELYPIDSNGAISATPLAPAQPMAPAAPATPMAAAVTPTVGTPNPGDMAEDTIPPPEIRAQAPPASAQARNEAYLANIAKQDQGYAANIKAIADYQANPSMFSVRNNRKERVMADVYQYDPTYDSRRYASTNASIKAFATGTQGNAVRSFNVAIEHLGTAEELGEALKNGNTQMLNSLRNHIQTALGYSAAPSFDTAKIIVGDEIAKAVVGGQTAERDRAELQARLSTASSPDQLRDVIGTFKKLMAGQVIGLKRQYEDTTGLHNFDERLTPRTRSELQKFGGAGGEAPRGTAPAAPTAPAMPRPGAAPAVAAAPPVARKRVIQNGHTYEQQDDGSFQAVQ